jgi:hypothetical protein
VADTEELQQLDAVLKLQQRLHSSMASQRSSQEASIADPPDAGSLQAALDGMAAELGADSPAAAAEELLRAQQANLELFSRVNALDGELAALKQQAEVTELEDNVRVKPSCMSLCSLHLFGACTRHVHVPRSRHDCCMLATQAFCNSAAAAHQR